MSKPVNDLADNLQSAAIFGGAKPHDEREYELRKEREKRNPIMNGVTPNENVMYTIASAWGWITTICELVPH